MFLLSTALNVLCISHMCWYVLFSFYSFKILSNISFDFQVNLKIIELYMDHFVYIWKILVPFFDIDFYFKSGGWKYTQIDFNTFKLTAACFFFPRIWCIMSDVPCAFSKNMYSSPLDVQFSICQLSVKLCLNLFPY